MVMAPVVRGRKGEYAKLLEEIRAQGYARAMIDGELRRLDEEIVLDKKFKHDISIVVDRLVMKDELRKRLAESVEAATGLAEGMVEVELVDSGNGAEPAELGGAVAAQGPGALGRRTATATARRLIFSEQFACLKCGTSMPELEPRIFSFNSPHGACERCHGLGFQRVIDPELIVPDPTLSISEGALQPFMRSASRYHRRLLRGGRREPRDRPRHAVAGPAQEGPRRDPRGHRRRAPRRQLPQPLRPPPLLHGALRAASSPSSSAATATPTPTRRASGSSSCMALQPCPACDGARLRPESLAVTVGGLNIHEFTRAARRARRSTGSRSSS